MIDTTNTSYDYLSEPLVDGGILNEQGVMNVALSFFDITRDIDDDAGEKEVILFKQVLPIAKRFCASMSDWSFLVDTVEYEEEDVYNDEPVPYDSYTDKRGCFKGKTFDIDGVKYVHVYKTYKDYIFGYRLPSDFMKVRYINDDIRIGYAIKGNVLYCNHLGVFIDYISDRMNSVPLEFGYLIAYRCAIEMANHLDPEGTAFQRATSALTQVYTILKAKDDEALRLQNPPQNQYIDIDSAYWGYKR